MHTALCDRSGRANNVKYLVHARRKDRKAILGHGRREGALGVSQEERTEGRLVLAAMLRASVTTGPHTTTQIKEYAPYTRSAEAGGEPSGR